MKIDYIISDHHFGETNMKIMQRPFKDDAEMFARIKANHNRVVKPTDHVLFVGDIVSKRANDAARWLSCVSQLNGTKTIIRGNHDENWSECDLLSVFDSVVPEGDGLEFEAPTAEPGRNILCYATHYPTQGRVDAFNIVGHIHSAWKYQKNMLNVCVDVHDYTPLPISDIDFYFKAIESFYDDDVWCAGNKINATYNDVRGKKGSYFKQKVLV